jgi:hypothetical protein
MIEMVEAEERKLSEREHAVKEAEAEDRRKKREQQQRGHRGS